MKQLIIIGAGGMGRTLYSNVLESRGYSETFSIKGFIDDNLHSLDGLNYYPPIVGTISEYQPEADDVFVCSIGGNARKPCMESIMNRGGEFINIIHRTARLLTNVVIGKGNFIGADTVIGNDAVIGNYNMIQSYSIIGHDAQIGDFNRIDTRVTCVGGIVVGNEVMIHSSAVISHNVRVGDRAHVAALSFVIKDVEAGASVMGNPARRFA
jgi:sugar O-acyltransferase (sialic acid O-acetyltransferase NeuD family)